MLYGFSYHSCFVCFALLSYISNLNQLALLSELGYLHAIAIAMFFPTQKAQLSSVRKMFVLCDRIEFLATQRESAALYQPGESLARLAHLLRPGHFRLSHRRIAYRVCPQDDSGA